MTRIELANRIAAGLAGWFQQLAAQNLEDQVGEDAARVEVVRMISAQRTFVPDTSRRPTNWPATTKKRIDIAVLGKRQNAEGWYGAIELKWPGASVDVAATRQRIVEDAVRVAFAETANICANLVILGGTQKALEALFDKQHINSPENEEQRIHFCSLFSRATNSTVGQLTSVQLNTYFPDCGDRVPQTTFDGWSRRLKTELLTVANATVGTDKKGDIYIWQCRK